MGINKILYIVILYNQKFENTNVYISLLSKIDNIKDIYIWDNSLNELLNQDLLDKGYNYIYSKNNMGVSYPYNRGLEYAMKNDYRWVTFLDQDTIFPATYLSILHSSLNENPDIKLFCPRHKINNERFLSPVKAICNITRLSIKRIQGKFPIRKYSVINSGLTIKMELYVLTGGYNEKVFLDYSDFEFIKRCSQVIDNGFCLDIDCIQDFSNEQRDTTLLLKRLILFCCSVKGCNKKECKDFVGYNLVVLKRIFSLSFRLKSFKPFGIYYKYYLLKSK